MKLFKIKTVKKDDNLIILGDKNIKISETELNKDEFNYLLKCIDEDQRIVTINQLNRFIFCIISEETKEKFQNREKYRKHAYLVCSMINSHRLDAVTIIGNRTVKDFILAFIEALILTNYQFLKYKTKEREKEENKLKEIRILDENISSNELNEISVLTDSVYFARNIINEPLIFLNSVKLSEIIHDLAEKSGYKAEVLDKKQIESLKMGGLLAVNKGSSKPPTFSILEWKPESSYNKKPLIVVGKGIVYDTGGLSIKPTPNSMDQMKSDMAGAAVVIALISAISLLKLPVYIIGLIPATDNAVSEKAYVPGDIIKMHNGTTVEVMNTDAEGRLILADALSYAKKFDPELVIDLATLTGSAARAVGDLAIVAMGNLKNKLYAKVEDSGNQTYERIVRFPLWEEYSEMLKSDIADIKNLGGADAGAITAGKFLETFIDYPWLHLDIATNAFLTKNNDYRGTGGTGTGIRLLYHFIKSNYCEKEK